MKRFLFLVIFIFLMGCSKKEVSIVIRNYDKSDYHGNFFSDKEGFKKVYIKGNGSYSFNFLYDKKDLHLKINKVGSCRIEIIRPSPFYGCAAFIVIRDSTLSCEPCANLD